MIERISVRIELVALFKDQLWLKKKKKKADILRMFENFVCFEIKYKTKTLLLRVVYISPREDAKEKPFQMTVLL